MSSRVEPCGSGSMAFLKRVPVLIVEDSWHVAKALKSSLEQLEMCVIGPTATAAEARHLVAEQTPQLAVVDVNIKDGIATELIDELHAQGVQVIVVSGYASPPINWEKAGAFIQKPYSAKELITVMCGILDPSRLRSEWTPQNCT
jgi:DNA-binding NtrC family response regulator